MKPLLPLLAAIAALALPLAHAAKGPEISKCRDETGRWHYGDTAAEECAKSKITVLNEGGIAKKEIAAPMTDAELKKVEDVKTAEQKKKEQAKKDELLLTTYGTEADITYIRDRKLAQIESSIHASQDTLKSLQAALARTEAQAAEEQKTAKAVSESTAKSLEQIHSQVAKHEAAIAMKRQEQEVLKAQAAADLERYRELRSPRVAKP